MRTIYAMTLVAALGAATLSPSVAQAQASAQETKTPKAVYHLDDSQANGLKALRNIRNHLNTAPETDIVLVAHSQGVDMFMEGARHGQSGTDFAPLIADLKAKGVKFQICEITLQRRNLSKDKFILEVDYTPSGVVALTDLQLKEGRAYIKP